MQLTFVHKITRVFNVIVVPRASFLIEVTMVFAARSLEARIRESCFLHFIVDSFITALEEVLSHCIFIYAHLLSKPSFWFLQDPFFIE